MPDLFYISVFITSIYDSLPVRFVLQRITIDVIYQLKNLLDYVSSEYIRANGDRFVFN